jgi:hypothetical protein
VSIEIDLAGELKTDGGRVRYRLVSAENDVERQRGSPDLQSGVDSGCQCDGIARNLIAGVIQRDGSERRSRREIVDIGSLRCRAEHEVIAGMGRDVADPVLRRRPQIVDDAAAVPRGRGRRQSILERHTAERA